jgi:adenine deaminase
LLGNRGRLDVGAAADLIAFRWVEDAATLEIKDVVANGRVVA